MNNSVSRAAESGRVPKGVGLTCFSIFFRGCKLLKSFHIIFSDAKIKIISGL